MGEYAAYLTILKQLTCVLEQLSKLGREKLTAVRQDDLDGLNQILNQEQALSMSIRGLEHKRQTSSGELRLAEVPLKNLVERYPEDMRYEAKETVDQLREQYQVYRGVSDSVRNALECGLHEIDKVLEKAGASNVGYPGMDVELPSRLRTDIHA
jgi:hypothetical protein